MNRGDLQKVSNVRIREAQVLFGAGEHSGAYYLAGYSVECALKACFAKAVKRYDFPEKTRAGRIFTHRLPELLKLANLESELTEACKVNLNLDGNWLMACTWTEDSRYTLWSRTAAEEMLEAIAGKKNGVLPWIKRRW